MIAVCPIFHTKGPPLDLRSATGSWILDLRLDTYRDTYRFVSSGIVPPLVVAAVRVTADVCVLQGSNSESPQPTVEKEVDTEGGKRLQNEFRTYSGQKGANFVFKLFKI